MLSSPRRRTLRGLIGTSKRYGRLDEMARYQTALACEKLALSIEEIAFGLGDLTGSMPVAPAAEDVERVTDALGVLSAGISATFGPTTAGGA